MYTPVLPPQNHFKSEYERRVAVIEAEQIDGEAKAEVLSTIIGEIMIAERAWEPLCPEYPNLKGATCEEVEAVIPGRGCEDDEDVAPEMCALVKEMLEKGGEYQMLRTWWHCFSKEPDANFKLHANHLSPEECEERRVSDADLECKCEPMGIGDRQFLRCRDRCKLMDPHDDWYVEKHIAKARSAGAAQTAHERAMTGADLGPFERPDSKAMDDLDRFIYRESSGYKQESPLRGRKEHEEYIKAARCYSRDEMFVAFKDLGNRIRYQMNPLLRDWDLKTTEERKMHLEESAGRLGPSEDPYSLSMELVPLIERKIYQFSLAEMNPKDRDLLMRVGRLHPLATERWDIYSDGDPLKDKEGSVFITTPRGGFEMLGIFAYANEMPKHKFPGDFYTADIEFKLRQAAEQVGYAFANRSRYHEEIKELERKPIKDLDMDRLEEARSKFRQADLEYQKDSEALEVLEAHYNTSTTTWLYDVAHNVRRVFVVDDIVASGDQLTTLLTAVKKTMPKDRFVVYPVLLCARSPLESEEMTNRGTYHVCTSPRDKGCARSEMHNVFDDSYTYQRTQGIRRWHRAYEEWAAAASIEGDTEHVRLLRKQIDDRAPTCVFPHSIADGASDRILIRVYGDRVWKGKLRVMRERKDT